MQLLLLQGIMHSLYLLRHFGTVRNGCCTKPRRVGPWTQYRNGAGTMFGEHPVMVRYLIRSSDGECGRILSYSIAFSAYCIVRLGAYLLSPLASHVKQETESETMANLLSEGRGH